MWRAAIAARADRVTITSYNEWHEGTQIEPAARPRRRGRLPLPLLRRRVGSARPRRGVRVPGANALLVGRHAQHLAGAAEHQAVVDVCGRRRHEAAGGRGRRSHRATSRARAPRAPSSEPKQRRESTEMTPRLPVWRRAIDSSSRSSSSGSMRTFESEPMQRPSSRWQTRATGRKPSPRLASVVGHAQMREPASRRRSSSCPSACVACTTVERGPRQPVRASSSIGRTPCSAHALLDLARLLVGVHVQRQLVLGGVATELLERVGRARPDGVGGDPDADPVRAQLLELRQVLRHRGLAEARAAAAQVTRVEADECDPGLLGRVGRRSGLLEAEVVELADRRVAVRA